MTDIELTNEASELEAQSQIEASELETKQKKYCLTMVTQLVTAGVEVTPQKVWSEWPREASIFFNANPAPSVPSIKWIEEHVKTAEFGVALTSVGINLNYTSTITEEQSAFLIHLSNISDKKSLARKMKDHKISPTRWKAWLTDPAFKRAYQTFGNNALLESMPLARMELGRQIANGNLAAIKFGMEVTGEYNPALSKQVDAERLVGIILEVLEDEIKDPVLLGRIATKMSARRSMEMGIPVQGSSVQGIPVQGSVVQDDNSEIMAQFALDEKD